MIKKSQKKNRTKRHNVFWSVRNILASQSRRPHWYNAIQQFFGSQNMWEQFVLQYLPKKESYSILDIGCGTASILQYLPATVQYTGVDAHQPYIDSCNNKYHSRGQFICGDWSIKPQREPVDCILLLGLLHHLDDKEAKAVIRMGLQHLNTGGILLCLDGCREADRSTLEELFYLIDRGTFIRSPEEYQALFPTKPTIHIHNNWLRVPYRYLICQVEKE